MLERKETTGRWKTVYYVNNEGHIVRKKCRDCLETKDLTEFYKSKSGGLGGRRSKCSSCDRAEYRDYYRTNSKSLIKKRMENRSKNLSRDYETQVRYTSRNRNKINKRRSMYPANVNRAAREFGLPANLTVEDKEFLLDLFGGCALTGETENIHLDHVIPLTTGVGGTVTWNIIPLKAGLNISKGNKNIFEWFDDNKERFNLSDEKFERTLNFLAKEKGTTVADYKKFVYEAFKNKEE